MVADGEVVAAVDVTMEHLYLPTIGGRRMALVTGTMEVVGVVDMVDAAEEEETIGEEVAHPLLLRTGLSLHLGTKGLRKSCLVQDMDLPGSISTGLIVMKV